MNDSNGGTFRRFSPDTRRPNHHHRSGQQHPRRGSHSPHYSYSPGTSPVFKRQSSSPIHVSRSWSLSSSEEEALEQAIEHRRFHQRPSSSGNLSSMFSPNRLTTRSFFQPRRWACVLNADIWRESEMGLQVSPQDDRVYRIIRLSNGLKAMLVSDPTSKKAAAAISVRMGALHDPPQAPGLAHFLEHMLFLGTSKYPRENVYKEAVNRHGGTSNASTAMDMTVYQFSVTAKNFEPVLDIFSQFFIAPLFTESATEREMHAVDSENSKNLTSDDRRMLQVMKSLADPTHPWSNFSTGNLSTLRDDLPPDFNIRTALLDLYHRHYVASNMGLALVSPDGLDTMEGWVRDKFHAIPTTRTAANCTTTDCNGNANSLQNGIRSSSSPSPASSRSSTPASLISVSSSRNGSNGATTPCSPVFRSPFPPRTMEDGSNEAVIPVVRFTPLRDKRELQIDWPLPPTRALYRAPPTRLFGHLLGHEGEGSIFSVLHGNAWASAVSAGVNRSLDDFAIFELTVSLTEEGEKHWEDIVSLIFHYIKLIGQSSNEDLCGMWDELRAISSTNFRFQQKTSEYSYAQTLARHLQLYPDRHSLSAGYLLDELDPELTRRFLGYLSEEENCLIFHTSKANEGRHECKERWYGVTYGVDLIPAAQIKSWPTPYCESLHLPKPNPFIAEDFNLLMEDFEPPSATPSPPKLVKVSSTLHTWYKLDSSFKQPRAIIVAEVITPVVQRDPTLADMLVRYLDHALAESTYDGSIAGLSWSVSTSVNGLTLNFSGFSHKLQTLVNRVTESFLSLNVQEGLFSVVKEKACQAYRNVSLKRADEHASLWLSLLLQEGKWSWRDKLDRAQTVDAAELEAFHKQVLLSSVVRVGVFGNMGEGAALGIGEQMEMQLQRNTKFRPLSASNQPITRLAMLQAGWDYRFRAAVPNKEDENSAVYAYYQLGDLTIEDQAKLSLLAQVIKEPLFTQLRTVEQLGYVVASGPHVHWITSLIGALAFRILSKTFTPEAILERLEAFLPTFRDKMATMEMADFERHKKSLVTNLLEPPKTLSSEVSKHWSEIINSSYLWDRNKRVSDMVESLTLPELVEFYDDLVGDKNKMKRMTVMVYGKNHPIPPLPPSEVLASGVRVVNIPQSDWLAFRQSRPLFPFVPAVGTSLSISKY